MKGLLNTIVKIIFSITIIVIWLVVPILADSQVDIWMIISPITLAAIGAIVYCKNKHKNNERTSDSYSRYLDDKLKNK